MYFDAWNLQLFADGEGGEGSDSGDTAAAAGQERLRELGVPENKIRSRASKAVGQQVKANAPAEAQAQTQDAAAEVPSTEEPKEAKKALKDLLAENPEYNEEVQAIIRARLKGNRDAEGILGQLAPALEVLARQYQMDPEKMDYTALAQAINNDDQYYESMALASGTDVETARQLDQQQRQQQREARTLEQQRYIEHFDKLEQQGEALKATFPNFDLRTELQNPAFARMVHPDVGVSVEDAFYVIHRQEIQAVAMQATAQRTAQGISNAIASGQMRPAEAGQTSQGPSVTTFDYKNASRQQREALKAQIRAAAARGEKIYPGR